MDDVIVNLANRVVSLDDTVTALNRQQQEWERGFPVARHLLIARRNEAAVARDLAVQAMVMWITKYPILAAKLLAGDKT